MPDIDQWRTGRLLSTAARLVQHAWNERLARIGVTHAGVIALGVLESQGPMSQTKIAQLVRVQAQTMGKTLSRLESHGHVTRVRSEQDRRSQLVTITEPGRQVLVEARDIERNLVPAGGLLAEDFRNQLKLVIRELDQSRVSGTSILPDVDLPPLDAPGTAGPDIGLAETDAPESKRRH